VRDLSIEVPDDVYDYCEETVERTDFSSVQEYVQFVLEAVCTDDGDDESANTEADRRDVDSHLESLGYK
jgi:Arc/MetJ-type ribon-helix-helix transcriptional regulator